MVSGVTDSLRVSNGELATVREAMRELHRLLDQLDEGQLEKIVLTQKNQMRAVLISVERYAELEALAEGHEHHVNKRPDLRTRTVA
jgi:PHD/YefM family antitoxin component YafN of YafNO toxin-antitoxin module